MNKYLNKSSKLVLSICLLVASLGIFSTLTYAWFTTNDKASANGVNFKVMNDIPLKIYKTESGSDISSAVISAESVHIDTVIDDGYSTIQPGSSGYFTFYCEYNVDNHSDSYDYNLNISISNNKFAEDEGYQSGVKESAKEEANTYLNSHILFFEELNDGLYSKWIKANDYHPFSFVESESKYIDERNIYWVWVQDYNDVFGGGNTLISQEDKETISTYYTIPENRKYVFLNEEKSLDGYDGADYTIGTTIKYICFELSFS